LSATDGHRGNERNPGLPAQRPLDRPPTLLWRAVGVCVSGKCFHRTAVEALSSRIADPRGIARNEVGACLLSHGESLWRCLGLITLFRRCAGRGFLRGRPTAFFPPQDSATPAVYWQPHTAWAENQVAHIMGRGTPPGISRASLSSATARHRRPELEASSQRQAAQGAILVYAGACTTAPERTKAGLDVSCQLRSQRTGPASPCASRFPVNQPPPPAPGLIVRWPPEFLIRGEMTVRRYNRDQSVLSVLLSGRAGFVSWPDRQKVEP